MDTRQERLLTVHARECEWTLVREERLLTVHARECEWTLVREECLLTVCTYIIVSLLKANTYLLQCHFKNVHTRNCSFIYKKVKMKGGLGWMKKYIWPCSLFNGNHFSSLWSRILVGCMSLQGKQTNKNCNGTSTSYSVYVYYMNYGCK